MKFNSTAMTRSKMVDVIVFVYIALFVYAAVSKLLDYQKFSVQLGQSPMLTDYAAVLAWLVPVIELVIACSLLLSKARLVGLYAAFSLMVMFTTYILILATYSDYVPCSCGGVLESMGWSEHFVFNMIFVVLAGAAIFMMKNSYVPKAVT